MSETHSPSKPDIKSYTHSSIFNVVQPDKHLVVELRSFKDLSIIENDITTKLLQSEQTLSPAKHITTNFITRPAETHYISAKGIPSNLASTQRRSLHTALSSTASSSDLRTRLTKLSSPLGTATSTPVPSRRSSVSRRTSFDKNSVNAGSKDIEEDVFVQLNQFNKKVSERNIEFLSLNKNQLQSTLNYLEHIQEDLHFSPNVVRKEYQNPKRLQQNGKPKESRSQPPNQSVPSELQTSQQPDTFQHLQHKPHNQAMVLLPTPASTKSNKPTLPTIESSVSHSGLSASRQQTQQVTQPLDVKLTVTKQSSFNDDQMLTTPLKVPGKYQLGLLVHTPHQQNLIDEALIQSRLNQNTGKRNSIRAVDQFQSLKTPIKIVVDGMQYETPQLAKHHHAANNSALKSAISHKEMFFSSSASTNAESLANGVIRERLGSERQVKRLQESQHVDSHIHAQMSDNRSGVSQKKARFAETQQLQKNTTSTRTEEYMLTSQHKQSNTGYMMSSIRQQQSKSPMKPTQLQSPPPPPQPSPSKNQQKLPIIQPFDDLLSPLKSTSHLLESLQPTLDSRSRSEELSDKSSDTEEVHLPKEPPAKPIFRDSIVSLDVPESIQRVTKQEESGRFEKFLDIFGPQKELDQYTELPAVTRSGIRSGLNDFIKNRNIEDMNRMKTFYRFAFNAGNTDKNTLKLQSIVKEVIPQNEKGTVLCNELWSDRHVKTISERTNFLKEKEVIHRYLAYKARHPVKSAVILTKRRVVDLEGQQQQESTKRYFSSKSTPPSRAKSTGQLDKNTLEETTEKKDVKFKIIKRKFSENSAVDFLQEKNLFKDFLSYTDRVIKNNGDDIKQIVTKIKEEEALKEEEMKLPRRAQNKHR